MYTREEFTEIKNEVFVRLTNILNNLKNVANTFANDVCKFVNQLLDYLFPTRVVIRRNKEFDERVALQALKDKLEKEKREWYQRRYELLMNKPSTSAPTCKWCEHYGDVMDNIESDLQKAINLIPFDELESENEI
jgi:hypothetical protein